MQDSGQAENNSLNFYKNIFANSSVGMTVYDASGRCIEANDAICTIIGATREQVLAQNYLQIESWEKSGLLAVAKSAVKNNRIEHIEATLTSTFGRHLTIDCQMIPFAADSRNYLLFMAKDLTDRKQAEIRLHEREFLFRELFDNMSSGVAVYSAVNDGGDFIFKDFNKAGLNGTWKTKDQVIGRSVREVFPGVEDMGLFAVFQRVWKTGTPEHYPVSLYQDERLSRWFDNYVFRLPGGEVIAVYDDITREKQHEETLIREKRFTETAINAQTDTFFVFNPVSKKAVTWNKAFREISGYSDEEIAELPAPDSYYAQEALFRTADAIEQILKGEKNITVDLELITKHGGTVPFEYRANLIPGKEMGEQYIVSVGRDITERLRAESALKKAAMEWNTAMDAYDDVIYLLDLDRHVLHANRAFYNMTGLTPEDVVGRHIEKIIHPEGEKEPCQVCVAQMEKKDCLITMEADDPHNPAGIPINIVVQVIRDEKGNPLSILMSLRDLSATRMAMEERILLETNLRQAQKMEAIGTLAGGIAHDFNNILSIILGYTEITSYEIPQDSPSRKNLDEVLRAVNRARDLVSQILTFSRKSNQEFRPLNLREIVRETIRLLRATIPTTVEIKQYIDNSCGNIIADSTQIHQVIMNLCTNAVHAMDEKGTLTITLHETTLEKTDLAHRPDMAAGRYVRLSVSDTGTGIAPDIADHIFDPFFTTKEASQGTGMGLSVVHGIVMSHHGMIKVDSEPGKGSTFHVCFAVTGGKNGRLARSAAALPTGTERILIVDDEESIIVTLVMILERLGYKTTAKTNGKDALETFKADPAAFDLVITDQTMPQLSGVELAIELLKIKPGLPIILCTGYSKKISDETAREIGIRKFLLKPLDRTMLAKAVRLVLDSDKEPSPGN